jgi:glycosyltransferase involved in cell wall biosynthesis
MKEARRADASIVHFCDGVVPIVRSIPTVVAVHDLSVVTRPRWHPIKRWARIPLVVLSPRLADAVIVPSTATADELMRVTGLSAARITVSPYAPQHNVTVATRAAVDATRTKYGLSSADYIVSVGTIEPRKNHVRLIEAFEIAWQRNDLPRDVRLVVTGRPGWDYRRVLRAAEASAAAKQISILGFVDEVAMSALLTGARAAAYVSLYEGFGLPVVEAMACGTPTVTSNVSSMPEIAGDAGFLVDPFDSSSIARGLARAFEAGRDRETIARRSKQQAAKFSWRRAAVECLDVYARVSQE